MLNTFDALATFGEDKTIDTADNAVTNDNASVDMGAIVARITALESRINELSRERTTPPTPSANNSAPNNTDAEKPTESEDN